MLEKLKQVLYEEYKTNGLTICLFYLLKYLQKEEFDQYKKKFNTLY